MQWNRELKNKCYQIVLIIKNANRIVINEKLTLLSVNSWTQSK